MGSDISTYIYSETVKNEAGNQKRKPEDRVSEGEAEESLDRRKDRRGGKFIPTEIKLPEEPAPKEDDI